MLGDALVDIGVVVGEYIWCPEEWGVWDCLWLGLGWLVCCNDVFPVVGMSEGKAG